MKILSVIFLLFTIATSVFAGEDSLYIEIKGDTVKIWNTDVTTNCCTNFQFDVTIMMDSINVIELDTAKDWCTCTCAFDLCTSITGLLPGTYYVSVFRYLPYADSQFVGILSFTINNSNSPSNSISGYQSKCKDPSAIFDDELYVPKNFNPWQNYPNPFNPSTIIRYDIPENGHVKLSVYDILGREVAILVNEYTKVGRYEIEFQSTVGGRQLTSGVYFYRLVVSSTEPLRAGDFVAVKKFLLLK